MILPAFGWVDWAPRQTHTSQGLFHQQEMARQTQKAQGAADPLEKNNKTD